LCVRHDQNITPRISRRKREAGAGEKTSATVSQKILAELPGRDAKAELFLATDETQMNTDSFFKARRAEISVEKHFNNFSSSVQERHGGRPQGLMPPRRG
jgi:hypothetical protein